MDRVIVHPKEGGAALEGEYSHSDSPGTHIIRFIDPEKGVYVARTERGDKLEFPDCHCEDWGPVSHVGSMGCRSHSLASGGHRAHCTCDTCF